MRSAMLSITVALALAAAAATAAFFIGELHADAPGSYEHGVADGQRMGVAETRAAFAPGHAEYAKIAQAEHTRGFREGRDAGVQDAAERQHDAENRLRYAPLAGFANWTVGRWYLVSFVQQDGGLEIDRRVPLAGGRWYGLCAGSTGLCRRTAQPAPPVSRPTTPSSR